MTSPGKPILCPSAPCRPGAILLGLVQGDGTVCLADELIVIDETFVEEANKGRSPEKRFRFAGSCLRSACGQWTGTRCGVIDAVLRIVPRTEQNGVALPRCSIREQCRWFSQSGAEACAVCPLVITDLREQLT